MCTIAFTCLLVIATFSVEHVAGTLDINPKATDFSSPTPFPETLLYTDEDVTADRPKRTLVYLMPVRDSGETIEERQGFDELKQPNVFRRKERHSETENASDQESQPTFRPRTIGESLARKYSDDGKLRAAKDYARNSQIPEIYLRSSALKRSADTNDDKNVPLLHALGKKLPSENYDVTVAERNLNVKPKPCDEKKYVCYCQEEECREKLAKKGLLRQPYTKQPLPFRKPKLEKKTYKKIADDKRRKPLYHDPLENHAIHQHLPILQLQHPPIGHYGPSVMIPSNHTHFPNYEHLSNLHLLPILGQVPHAVNPYLAGHFMNHDVPVQPDSLHTHFSRKHSQECDDDLRHENHQPSNHRLLGQAHRNNEHAYHEIVENPSNFISLPIDDNVGTAEGNIALPIDATREPSHLPAQRPSPAPFINFEECMKLYDRNVCVLAAKNANERWNHLPGQEVYEQHLSNSESHVTDVSENYDPYRASLGDEVIGSQQANNAENDFYRQDDTDYRNPNNPYGQEDEADPQYYTEGFQGSTYNNYGVGNQGYYDSSSTYDPYEYSSTQENYDETTNYYNKNSNYYESTATQENYLSDVDTDEVDDRVKSEASLGSASQAEYQSGTVEQSDSPVTTIKYSGNAKLALPNSLGQGRPVGKESGRFNNIRDDDGSVGIFETPENNGISVTENLYNKDRATDSHFNNADINPVRIKAAVKQTQSPNHVATGFRRTGKGRAKNVLESMPKHEESVNENASTTEANEQGESLTQSTNNVGQNLKETTTYPQQKDHPKTDHSKRTQNNSKGDALTGKKYTNDLESSTVSEPSNVDTTEEAAGTRAEESVNSTNDFSESSNSESTGPLTYPSSTDSSNRGETKRGENRITDVHEDDESTNTNTFTTPTTVKLVGKTEPISATVAPSQNYYTFSKINAIATTSQDLLGNQGSHDSRDPVTTESTHIDESSTNTESIPNIDSKNDGLCDTVLLKSAIRKVINEFASNSTLGQSQGDELLPELKAHPNLKEIVSLPEIQDTILDRVRNLLAGSTGVSKERFLGNWNTDLLRNTVSEIFDDTSADDDKLPKMRVEEHQYKRGNWVTNLVTLAPPSAQHDSNLSRGSWWSDLQQRIKNLIGNPAVRLQSAHQPIVQNMIVQSIKKQLEEEKGEDRNIEDSTIRYVLESIIRDEKLKLEESGKFSDTDSTTIASENTPIKYYSPNDRVLAYWKNYQENEQVANEKHVGKEVNVASDQQAEEVNSSTAGWTIKKGENKKSAEAKLNVRGKAKSGGTVVSVLDVGTPLGSERDALSKTKNTNNNIVGNNFQEGSTNRDGIEDVPVTTEVFGQDNYDQTTTENYESTTSTPYIDIETSTDYETQTSSENDISSTTEENTTPNEVVQMPEQTTQGDDLDEDLSYFGKISLNPKEVVANLAGLEGSDLYYIGDGVRLPLEIRKLKDGSFALSISKKICQSIIKRKCPCCVPVGGKVVHTIKDRTHQKDNSRKLDTDAETQIVNRKRSRARRDETRSAINNNVKIIEMPVIAFAKKYNLSLNLSDENSSRKSISTNKRTSYIKSQLEDFDKKLDVSSREKRDSNYEYITKGYEDISSADILTGSDNLNINSNDLESNTNDVNNEVMRNLDLMYGYQSYNPILERMRTIEKLQKNNGPYRYQQDIDERSKSRVYALKNFLHWLKELFMNTEQAQ